MLIDPSHLNGILLESVKKGSQLMLEKVGYTGRGKEEETDRGRLLGANILLLEGCRCQLEEIEFLLVGSLFVRVLIQELSKTINFELPGVNFSFKALRVCHNQQSGELCDLKFAYKIGLVALADLTEQQLILELLRERLEDWCSCFSLCEKQNFVLCWIALNELREIFSSD